MAVEGFGARVGGLGNDGEGLVWPRKVSQSSCCSSVDFGVVVIGGEELVQILVDAIAGADVR